MRILAPPRVDRTDPSLCSGSPGHNYGPSAFFTRTIWRGRRCMRVSVSSWRTTSGDVDRAVAAAERALQVGAGQPV
jgi:hypothetical protein